ncbi:MAG: hypothetical protein NUV83_02745 [Candidatus Wolfebacteria bacterium]|nr:hypothetical protein [Candidatus Wolfebacteria bacterium]
MDGQDGQKKFSTGIQIAAVVVVIIIFGALYYYSKNMSSQPTEQPQSGQQTTTSSQQASSTNSTKTKPGATTKKSTAPTPEQSVTYDQAINTYGSKRIQFDPSCGVIPSYSNYLNNTKVMFDNRYEKGRWFYLDGKGYYLESYGFKIVTLYSKTLPHTVKIDCGAGKNNGQILLQ